MEDIILDQLILNSEKQISWSKQFVKKRYLFPDIVRLDKEYFVGIKGLRGIGKTVLLLQLAQGEKHAVYFSADATALKSFSLYTIVKALLRRDYKHIFIDEIHRKPGWDVDVKSLYDEHEGRILFTGSSALDITKTGADLSRRVVLKELLPASFREFLNLRKGYEIPPMSFDHIVKNKHALVKKYTQVFTDFSEYQVYGGMLFPKNGFYDALENSLRKIVLQDLSALRDINVKYETDIYKFLHLVARSSPYELNYSSIASALRISKTLAIRIVNDLENTGIITVVYPCRKSGIDVKKEPKVYLVFPLRKFFEKQGMSINVGAIREEYFVHHTREVCYIKGDRGEKTPDFRYKNTVIEVGGQSKKNNQGADYIATDSMSTEGNRLPLFLFGFLY